MLFGCVAAAALALIVDRLLALAEDGVVKRSKARLLASAAGLLIVVGASLFPLFASAGGRPIVDGRQACRTGWAYDLEASLFRGGALGDLFEPGIIGRPDADRSKTG